MDFFTASFDIDAVLLVNSCARGRASRDSCLDMVVLAQPEVLASQHARWESAWERFNTADRTIEALKKVGAYPEVHLDFIDGAFAPQERDEAAGPDSFELELGNFLAYSVPLWTGSDYLAQLKGQWLPFYKEELRAQRLEMVRHYCRNNLRHIPLYTARGLYFQAFDRLYNGYQEFLQALFISCRIYPIAYNKWIQEQLEELLNLPALYTQLLQLFEIRDFASQEIAAKGREVEQLLDEHTPSQG